MNRSKRIKGHAFARPLLLAALLVVIGGCAGSRYAPDSVVRQAIDLPDHFLIGAAAGDQTMEPVADMSCRSPMVDPRDGTRLRLVRSAGGRGDYQAPAGRYGVGSRELLRLDCGTGRALGIVRR